MWCMFESRSSFDSVGSWEATRIFTVPIFYDADDVNEPIEKTDVLKILVCMTSAPHICAVVTVSIETGVHVNNGRTARRIRSRTNTSLLIARFWCARKSLACCGFVLTTMTWKTRDHSNPAFSYHFTCETVVKSFEYFALIILETKAATGHFAFDILANILLLLCLTNTPNTPCKVQLPANHSGELQQC